VVLGFDNKLKCIVILISIQTKNKTMWDQVFNICVDIMSFLGKLTGLTYNEINVVVFCILWPLHTLYLFILSYKARKAAYLLQKPNSYPKHLPFLFPALSRVLNIKNK
jgi:hypothetical protein